MKDAVKYSKCLYTFGDTEILSDKKGENKVFETNAPVTKFINELSTKVNDRNVNPVIRNSTRTAQIYFTHKLMNVKDKI
jgi:hypothetical protein